MLKKKLRQLEKALWDFHDNERKQKEPQNIANEEQE